MADQLARQIRDQPSRTGILSALDTLDTLDLDPTPSKARQQQATLDAIRDNVQGGLGDKEEIEMALYNLLDVLNELDPQAAPKPTREEVAALADKYSQQGGARKKKLSQGRRFCKCIKTVRKTLKARPGSTKEEGAIAVCVKSVLHKKGRTIKRFKCGKKPRVVTQKRK